MAESGFAEGFGLELCPHHCLLSLLFLYMQNVRENVSWICTEYQEENQGKSSVEWLHLFSHQVSDSGIKSKRVVIHIAPCLIYWELLFTVLGFNKVVRFVRLPIDEVQWKNTTVYCLNSVPR